MCALPPSAEAVPAGALALKKHAALDNNTSAMKLKAAAAAPPPPPRSLLARYVAFLERYKFGVLLFWALVMTLGYYGMSRVFPNLVLKVRSPRSACSYTARVLLRRDQAALGLGSGATMVPCTARALVRLADRRVLR